MNALVVVVVIVNELVDAKIGIQEESQEPPTITFASTTPTPVAATIRIHTASFKFTHTARPTYTAAAA